MERSNASHTGLGRWFEFCEQPKIFSRSLVYCIHKLCVACAVWRLSFGPFDVGSQILVGAIHSPLGLSYLFHRGHMSKYSALLIFN
jgi:hypothetical protein